MQWLSLLVLAVGIPALHGWYLLLISWFAIRVATERLAHMYHTAMSPKKNFCVMLLGIYA